MPRTQRTKRPPRHRRLQQSKKLLFGPYTPVRFAEIEARAERFADYLEEHFDELADILQSYESYEVARDETDRTLDLLRNLKENKAYFKLRVGPVAAFLPRNQPLYALTCFVIVPSLMASEVHFRIPSSMRQFLPKLIDFLKLRQRFPNIIVSEKQRVDFLEERSAVKVNPKKLHETVPVTDAVIFTGTSTHASQLRMIFDPRVLFITNGAGHNPVVVSTDADLGAAVEAVLTLTLYNQGQDCAAPNAILVHANVLPAFIDLLRSSIRATKFGSYRDRECRVGPISDPRDLVRIQDFLIEERRWLDPMTPGVIRARDAIVEPTIIAKPLREGGNFMEVFAPIIVVQEYSKDADLALYFEDPHYAPNAMYASVYGTSKYMKSLINRPLGGRVLHDRASILWNTHLHAHGVERGTHPYGGYGYGASNLSIRGRITPKPTLPQRDIYEWVAKPLLESRALRARLEKERRCTALDKKDVAKLMRLAEGEIGSDTTASLDHAYIDLKAVGETSQRYVNLGKSRIHNLLGRPNTQQIARLTSDDLRLIRALRKMLLKKPRAPLEDFQSALFGLAKKPRVGDEENAARQLHFFKNVYQLLLGQDSGPRLAQFLLDIDTGRAAALLDV